MGSEKKLAIQGLYLADLYSNPIYSFRNHTGTSPMLQAA
jgi:hypothetical protein